MTTFAQILRFLVVILIVVSTQLKKRGHILVCNILQNVVAIVSYFLLGLYPGCVMCTIAVIRSTIYFAYSRHKRPVPVWTLVLIEIAMIASAVTFWQNWFDAFLLAHHLLFSFASWQDNVVAFKAMFLICCAFLIVYDSLCKTYIYIATEVLNAGFAVLSIIMTNKKQKLQNQNSLQDDDCPSELKT